MKGRDGRVVNMACTGGIMISTLNNIFYEETHDPLYADRRNFYKVEKWSQDWRRVELMLYAGASTRRVAWQLYPCTWTRWRPADSGDKRVPPPRGIIRWGNGPAAAQAARSPQRD
jgi:hypothetical protein